MKKTSFSKIALYVFLVIVGFVSVFPFYWIVSGATNKSVEIVRGRMVPSFNLMENGKVLLKTIPMTRGFLNSLRNAVIGTLGSLFICSMAGYGFQIYRSKAKDRVMSILLLSMMIPFAAVMVPLFRLTSTLKLLNTTAGIVLPGLSTAFLIFFFRQCSQSFPMEIVQAARVDGVGEFGIYARVYFPIMAPTFAAAGIVTFMGAWNNYLWPLIVLQKETARTLPILIAQLTQGYVIDYGILTLAITITTIPTMLIFVTQQRRFVEGILGSVK
ncbi:MAG: carbohydrate ABC transporter permease [Treponema sp.]|jgi:lactose/L-arabinose transport system permease protein|nr:carbohydrate ABC transporter permease [Treponema sp.]